ncbi:MAG: hypothetical protein HC814_00245 [Rhodobacteraceae bacterium]|nr:hypothetical protein [Paracoccaceae bacterium]
MIRVVMVCMAALATSVYGAESDDQIRDLAGYKCKDAMRMSDSDHQILVAVMHGYIQGAQGNSMFDLTKLSRASDEFVEYCLDHPAEGALAAMSRIVKGQR